ncbi:hypothetical protein BJY01DRAFT_39029 [Aspergillus pseudoustus]|uniref:Actin-like ATPase domain-containing protein n=1 Tax=Aspergillus pseudoustus TaxID=1810923 RepID=A0ABR4JD79_9EURO
MNCPTMVNKNLSGIVGIDFGAKSSAAAFASGDSKLEGLKVLDQWPEATRRPLAQFPTSVEVETIAYYDTSSIGLIGWSEDKHEVVTSQGRLIGGIYVIADFKSRLFPPEDYPEEHTVPTLIRDMTADDIAVDYLRHLWRSVSTQAQSLVEVGTAKGTFQVMMTTPAFWNEETKTKFREITRKAGFTEEEGVILDLVSGLEAALFHTDYMDPSTFTVGDLFMVVDCGGALVEAAAFEVKAKNPLRLERQTSVSVASCGSAETTRRFINVASDKIDKTGLPSYGRVKPAMRRRCRTQFEREVLLGLGRTSFDIPPEAPGAFWVADVGVEFECPEADLLEGYMSFREDEIYPCFDFVIDRTLELVKDQIAAVEVHFQQLKGCLLVGGFNKCAYYSRKLEAGITSLGLTIIQPDYDPVAFAKGAALSGLNVQ